MSGDDEKKKKVSDWNEAGYYGSVFASDRVQVGNKTPKFDYNHIEKPTTPELKKLRDSYIKAAKLVYQAVCNDRKGSLRGDLKPLDQMSDNDLVAFAKSEMGWFSQNTVGLTKWFARLKSGNMTQDQKQAFGYLMEIHDHTATDLEDIGNFLYKGLIADPTTYVGLGTLGAGTVAAQGAKQLAKKGVTQIIKASLKKQVVKELGGLTLKQATKRQIIGAAMKASAKQTLTGTMIRGTKIGIQKYGLQRGLGQGLSIGLKSSLRNGSLAVAAEGAITSWYMDDRLQKSRVFAGVQDEYNTSQNRWSVAMGVGMGEIFTFGAGFLGRGTAGLYGKYFDDPPSTLIKGFAKQLKDGVGIRLQRLDNAYQGSSLQRWSRSQMGVLSMNPFGAAGGTRPRPRGGAGSTPAGAAVRGVAADGWTVPAPRDTILHKIFRYTPYTRYYRRFPGTNSTQKAFLNLPHEMFQRKFLLPIIKYLDDSVHKHGLVDPIKAMKNEFDRLQTELSKGLKTIEEVKNEFGTLMNSWAGANRTNLDRAVIDLEKLVAELDIKEAALRQEVKGTPIDRAGLEKMIDDYIAKYGGNREAMVGEIDLLQDNKRGYAKITTDAIEAVRNNVNQRISMFRNMGDGTTNDYIQTISRIFDGYIKDNKPSQTVADLMKNDTFSHFLSIGIGASVRRENWKGYTNHTGFSWKKVYSPIAYGLGFTNVGNNPDLKVNFQDIDKLQRSFHMGYHNPYVRDIPMSSPKFAPNKPDNTENLFIFVVKHTEESKGADIRAKELLEMYNQGREADALHAAWHAVNRAGKESKKNLEAVLKELSLLDRAPPHNNSAHYRHWRKRLDDINSNFPHNNEDFGQRDVYKRMSVFLEPFYWGHFHPGRGVWATPFLQDYGLAPVRRASQYLLHYPFGFRMAEVKKKVKQSDGTEVEKLVKEWKWNWGFVKHEDGTKWIKRTKFNPENWPSLVKALTYRPLTVFGRPLWYLANYGGKQLLTNPYVYSWPLAYLAIGGAAHVGEEALELITGEDYEADIGRKYFFDPTLKLADKTLGSVYRKGVSLTYPVADYMAYNDHTWFKWMNKHPGAAAYRWLNETEFKDEEGNPVNFRETQVNPANWHLDPSLITNNEYLYEMGFTPFSDEPPQDDDAETIDGPEDDRTGAVVPPDASTRTTENAGTTTTQQPEKKKAPPPIHGNQDAGDYFKIKTKGRSSKKSSGSDWDFFNNYAAGSSGGNGGGSGPKGALERTGTGLMNFGGFLKDNILDPVVGGVKGLYKNNPDGFGFLMAIVTAFVSGNFIFKGSGILGTVLTGVFAYFAFNMAKGSAGGFGQGNGDHVPRMVGADQNYRRIGNVRLPSDINTVRMTSHSGSTSSLYINDNVEDLTVTDDEETGSGGDSCGLSKTSTAATFTSVANDVQPIDPQQAALLSAMTGEGEGGALVSGFTAVQGGGRYGDINAARDFSGAANFTAYDNQGDDGFVPQEMRSDDPFAYMDVADSHEVNAKVVTFNLAQEEFSGPPSLPHGPVAGQNVRMGMNT